VAKQTVFAGQSSDVQHGCVQKLVMPAASYSPVVTVNESAQIPLVQAEAPAQGQPTAPGHGPEVSGALLSTTTPVSGGGDVSGVELSTVPVSATDTSAPVPESCETHRPVESHVPAPQLVDEQTGWQWLVSGLHTSLGGQVSCWFGSHANAGIVPPTATSQPPLETTSASHPPARAVAAMDRAVVRGTRRIRRILARRRLRRP
jgi:hypothetical protein